MASHRSSRPSRAPLLVASAVALAAFLSSDEPNPTLDLSVPPVPGPQDPASAQPGLGVLPNTADTPLAPVYTSVTNRGNEAQGYFDLEDGRPMQARLRVNLEAELDGIHIRVRLDRTDNTRSPLTEISINGVVQSSQLNADKSELTTAAPLGGATEIRVRASFGDNTQIELSSTLHNGTLDVQPGSALPDRQKLCDTGEGKCPTR